jgi:hypothetical protein
VPRAKAVLTFAAEFFLTRHYDYVDLRDLRPALAEMRYTASVLRKPRPGA